MSLHRKNRVPWSAPVVRWLLALGCLLAIHPSRADEDLVENGTFDNKEEPLKGWTTDYEWTGNKYYVANKTRVSVVDSEQGRTKVVKIVPAGDAGAKMESLPIRFEPGYRYTCTLDVKGGPYRVYFAGYKWQPGIRPHENPEPGELRLIYKSKASTGNAGSWTGVEIKLPGVTLSARAKQHLKQVRFLTVYVWMMKPGHIDNISVKRTADPALDF